jgi:hypothetical protein
MPHQTSPGDIDLTPGQPHDALAEYSQGRRDSVRALAIQIAIDLTISQNISTTVAAIAVAMVGALDRGDLMAYEQALQLAQQALTEDQIESLHYAVAVMTAQIPNFQGLDANELHIEVENGRVSQNEAETIGSATMGLGVPGGRAALNFSLNITPSNYAGLNPGAGWGGFSPTNEGGIATIDSSGKITWSGWGGSLANGGQAAFGNGQAALAAALAALASLFGLGREDNATPPAPPTPPEAPSEPGESDD